MDITEELKELKPKRVPYFADPDVSEEDKAAARLKGGRLGGKKGKYVQGTKVPLESLDDVLDGLAEVIANLKNMQLSVSSMNSLVRAYQVAANCYLEKEERDVIQAEIDALKEAMGLE